MEEEKDKSININKENKKTSLLFLTMIEIGEFIWDIGKTLIIVAILAFVIRFYLIQPFYVEGQSMEPSFQNGEYLLVDEISYHFTEPERGDVIVFKPPVNTYQNYIKRIIALPNEKISFSEEGNIIIKNEEIPEGVTIKEPYISKKTTINGEENVALKDSEFFVMGDNRPQSSDSRIFGPLARKNIIGKVWFYIKTEPWKQFKIFGTTINIPKITSIGKIRRPKYNP